MGAGADVDMQNSRSGKTALHYSVKPDVDINVYNKQLAVSQYLITEVREEGN